MLRIRKIFIIRIKLHVNTDLYDVMVQIWDIFIVFHSVTHTLIDAFKVAHFRWIVTDLVT